MGKRNKNGTWGWNMIVRTSEGISTIRVDARDYQHAAQIVAPAGELISARLA